MPTPTSYPSFPPHATSVKVIFLPLSPICQERKGHLLTTLAIEPTHLPFPLSVRYAYRVGWEYPKFDLLTFQNFVVIIFVEKRLLVGS